jgi:hypothetical protein
LTKRDLKLLYEKELEGVVSEEISETDESVFINLRDGCLNCHAKPDECKFLPGDEGCHTRRERYNRVQVSKSERTVPVSGGPGSDKKQVKAKSARKTKISDKKSEL